MSPSKSGYIEFKWGWVSGGGDGWVLSCGAVQSYNARTAMKWEDATPGAYSVLLVGAGFPLAVLNPKLPSTDNLIKDTATNHGNEFPLISALYGVLGKNSKLDDVWTKRSKASSNLITGIAREMPATSS